MLKKSLESSLDFKVIKQASPKGNQSWIFIGRTDAEAETPILWPPEGKNWLSGKDPDAGKDWRQEEKGTTEDEMAGYHHRLNGPEFGLPNRGNILPSDGFRTRAVTPALPQVSSCCLLCRFRLTSPLHHLNQFLKSLFKKNYTHRHIHTSYWFSSFRES